MLFAKILTYTLNAYLDAQIAEELLTYLHTQGKSFATQNTVAQQRAKKLAETVSITTIQKDPSYLIGLSYTQYYLNGLADILYADLFWPLIVSKQKSFLQGVYNESITRFCQQLTTTYHYEEFIHQPGIRFWYWPLTGMNPWRYVAQFAKERLGYTETINKDALRKASIAVQHQNSQNNQQVAHLLRTHGNSSDPKVLELRKIAQMLHQTPSFLTDAALTQEAAARWDRVFVWLITR